MYGAGTARSTRRPGNEYAYMLFPVVNAEAYLKGKVTDFSEVGVKALDDTTLEVTLNTPTPYFSPADGSLQHVRGAPGDAPAVWRNDRSLHPVDPGRTIWSVTVRSS